MNSTRKFDADDIFNASFDAILVANIKGIILAANKSAQQMLGQSEKEICGTSLFDFISEVEDDTAEDLFHEVTLQKLISSGMVRNRNLSFKRKNLEPISVLLSASASIGSDGKKRIICIAKDITELRLAAESLERERSNMIYAAKMKSLGEMSAGIAHEINSPLFIIQGYCHHMSTIANKDTVDLDELRTYIKKIENAVDRIAAIIKSLGSLSRNSESDTASDIAFSKILDDTLIFAQAKIKNAAVAFSKDDKSSNIKVHCNSSEITQVLLNLINNACDAASGNKEKWIRINVSQQKDSLKVSIIDSGTGISKEIQGKIMQPFFTTKSPGSGTGLGLSISQSLLVKNKGKLWLDTDAPNTTFVFTLPLA